MNIAITGYCGTGSSAVFDLLREYTTCSTTFTESYEHVAFYTPDGLFDLEDKLLIGNNLHRSDEAISSFYQAMERLEKTNFGWFGGLQKHFKGTFINNVNEFLNEISEFEFEGRWSYNAVMKFSLIQAGIDCIRMVLGKKSYRSFGEKRIDKTTNIIRNSFVSEEEFYRSAHKFVKNYLNMTKADTENTLYDHLLLPHNVWRMPKYFDDDFKIIIVDRDVRDLFVLGKYVWPALNTSAPFPDDAEAFISFWGKMRACEKQIDDARILRVNFEDLVYKYDETVANIERFLGLKSEDHVLKKQHFDPEKSIKNTQNYKMKKEWISEVENIQKNLPQYIYDFPYEIQTSIKEVFDK